MSRIAQCLVFAFAASFAAPLPAAQPSASPARNADREVLERMTAERMESLIRLEGFADVSIDEDEDLIVRMNGYQVLVSVSQNDYSVVLFHFALGGTRATLRDINDWNAKKLFSRAYLDDDGDPVLEMDVDLAGGVTVARLRDAIRTYSQLQTEFLRDVAIPE